ncbi:MAG: DUF2339 domain-containing protein [Planctomycetota bacterium]|jgi:uncharacterized membrane protein
MEVLVLLVLAIPVIAIIAIVLASNAKAEVRRLDEDLRRAIGRVRKQQDEILRRLDARDARAPRPEASPKPAPREGTETPEPLPPPPPLPVRESVVEAGPTPEPAPEVPSEREKAPEEAAVGEEAVPAVLRREKTPARRRKGREPAAPVPAADTAEAAREGAARSLEEKIGGRLFNWIGIVALIFGVAYLLKYANEQGWISPWMQFIGGLVFGGALLVAGVVTARRSYPVLAQGFWGGGIAILFLDFFAGHRIHGILSELAAFLGMAGTTVLGAALSIVYRSRAIAVLAAIGGYLAPVLIGSEEPSQLFLFTYLSILTTGLLVVGYQRAWRFLRYLCFFAMAAYLVGWWLQYEAADPILTVVFLGVFFLLFSADAVAWSIGRRVASSPDGILVLVATLALFGVGGLYVLEEHHPGAKGLFLLLGAGLQWVCAVAVRRRHPEDRPLTHTFGSSAALLFLLFPVFEERIQDHVVSITWALQALVFFAGLRLGGGIVARGWGLAALLLAAGRLGFVDTPRQLANLDPFTLFWNERGLTYGVVALAFAVVCWFYRRRERLAASAGEGIDDTAGATFETNVVTLIWIIAVALPVALLSLELRDAFESWVKPSFAGRATAYRHAEGLWMTLLWGGYAVLLVTIARRRAHRLLRDLGFVFLAFTLLKLALRDLGATYQTAPHLFFNARFAVTALLGAGLFWLSREFRRRTPKATALPRAVPELLVTGHVLVLAAVSMEWYDAMSPHAQAGFFTQANLLGLSVLAALHGALLVAWGSRRERSGVLLATGLALVGAAAVKWVLFDAIAKYREAETLVFHFRFLSGAVVAAITFWAASRWRATSKEGLDLTPVSDWPAFAVGAHLATLAVLSVEVFDLFRRHADTWTPDGTISVVKGAGFGLTAVWALYGAGLLLSGLRRGRRHARGLALLFLGASLSGVVGMVLFDYPRALHVALNSRFLLGGLTALALFWGAEVYRRRGPDIQGPALFGARNEAKAWRVPLSLLGHALAVLLLTLEANDSFTAGASAWVPEWLDVKYARQLSYSLIWMLYAIGMVFSGFIRQFKPVRLMALALLLVTVVKVFLLDLSFLQNPYRILSFIVLGLILVGVSYLYQRYKSYLVG